ncbi:MAG: hypothetical protein M0022_05440 [Desulfobacteraceae bacterium]|nr:hypothetical protein [Desulfobacteraceae bacterium]
MDTVLRASNWSEGTGMNMVDTAGLSMPDPEVLERKKSRHFTARYKIRIPNPGAAGSIPAGGNNKNNMLNDI